MNNINLGLLRAARRKKKMNMDQAGAIIGKDKSAIYRYESGITSPRVNDLLMLMDAYHVDFKDLFSQEVERMV